MNNKLIIIFIIICCCLLLSVIGGYFYKKYIDEYNKNIYEYNKKYNLNYYEKDNKVYTQTELNNMFLVYGTITSDITTKTIMLNNSKLTLYSGFIEYPIGDFYSGKLGNIKMMDNVLDNGLYNSKIDIKPVTNYVTSEKVSNVLCPIITTKLINKGDVIKLYYDPYKRVVPPFIESLYVQIK